MSRFEAVVQAEGEGVFVEVPAAVIEALGRKKRPPVVVDINGYRFRARPAVYGGRCLLGLRRDVREAAGVTAGQTVTVTLELDAQPREVKVPDDLAAALQADPKAEAAFAALSFTHRREHVEWVESSRREETRLSRVQRTVEKLKQPPQPE